MIIYKNRNLVIPVGLGPNFNNETVEIKNENKAVTITENGTEIVTYDPAEYTGLGIVQINTEVKGGLIQDPVRLDITENGNYDVRPDENYDGLSEVSVTVNVQPELEAKTVDSSTTSQVVTTNKYGLSSVTVNPYVLDEKTVDSSTVVQVVTSDEDGLKQVTINPFVLSPLEVDSSTANQEYTGNYNSVKVNKYTLDSKTVDSSTVSQIITSDVDGLSSVTVNPYVLDSSSLVIDENGEYSVTSAVDGLSRVDVSVNIDTQSYYDSGYSAGEAAGIIEGVAEQKSKLTSTTLRGNGNYTRTDGWNDVTVDVPSDIRNQSKTVDSSTNSQIITADVEYSGLGQVTINPYVLDSKTVDSSTIAQTVVSNEDGLSSVIVNPYTLDSSTLEITRNGQYAVTSTADGLSRVDVSVGIDTQSYYDSGYSAGKVDGKAEQRALLDSSTFTKNGTFTRYNGWNEITVDVDTVNNQPTKTVDSSTNTQVVTPDAGYTGLARVVVVPYVTQEKTQAPSPMEGSNIEVIPDTGKVLSKVTVLPAPISKVQWETVDQNGYYEYRKPSNDYYGMAGVNLTVNVKPPLQEKTVDSSTASQTIVKDSKDYYGLSSVTINPYVLDSKTVDPSTNSQTITSDADGLSSVIVNAVTSSIDSNISAGNIKNGVTILGVQGTYSGQIINNQNKAVDSSTNSQSITYDSGYTGLGTVTVNAVTSEIDSNIQAGNIKNGITILGVQGTYSGTTINNQNKTIDSSTSAQSVTYDSGYTGLGTVTVNPYTLQNKALQLEPSYRNEDAGGAVVKVEPDEGYDGLSYFQYRLPSILTSKTFDASTGNQTYVTNTANTYVKGINEIVINGLDLDSCYTLAASI